MTAATKPVAGRQDGGASAGKRRRTPAIASQRLALDAAMLIAAVGASALSALANPDGPPADLGWAAAFSFVSILALAYLGSYRVRLPQPYLDHVRRVVAGTAVAAMTITFVRVIATDNAQAASQAVRAWLFAAVYVSAGAGAMRLIQERRRRVSGGEPTLIVGAGRVGHLVERRLRELPEFGLRPVAFLDHDPLDVERKGSLPVLGAGVSHDDSEALSEQLEASVLELGIRHVIVTFSLVSHEAELKLVRKCQQLGVPVSMVPRLFEGLPDAIALGRLGALPLVSIYPTDPRSWKFAVKYALDRLFALTLLVLVSPLMLLTAAGVLISLGRPLLFRQIRVGLDGREFEMLKYRTMRGSPDQTGEADAAWAARIAGRADDDAAGDGPSQPTDEDRRTRLGGLLRRWGIDELPQLWNVLRGEMSMVGPRPERRAYVTMFERTVRRYDERHRVKAGITGWAQVHGLRGQTPLEDRIEWDNYYIENWSFWLDFKIVLLTFGAITRGPDG